MHDTTAFDRRSMLRGAALGGLGLGLTSRYPAWARSGSPGLRADRPTLTGEDIRLRVGHSAFSVGGKTGPAITVNGVLPAPLIRLKEGQNVRIHVENTLDEDTSIHWHGLILPFHMDGVPGHQLPRHPAQADLHIRVPDQAVRHLLVPLALGLQEQAGHYGPLVIDPGGRGARAVRSRARHRAQRLDVPAPAPGMAKVKNEGGYFNRPEARTSGDRVGPRNRMSAGRPRDVGPDADGLRPTSPDVTGTTYTYPHQRTCTQGRTGRAVQARRAGAACRIINAPAMKIFNVRIPGPAPMTIVQRSGRMFGPCGPTSPDLGRRDL
jgi:FtsP/CotA-like multicopper oxidase with cupredoxin domain